MSLDDALFLVDRAGTLHHSKGSDIGDRMQTGDMVLVQRGTDHFKATYDGNEWSTIQDSDLLLAWDGTNNRKVTGANFKTLFGTTTSSLDDAQECHRECYREYQNCKLLCETAYCRSICDAQYEECVAECYETRGLTVPAILIPPPRA